LLSRSQNPNFDQQQPRGATVSTSTAQSRQAGPVASAQDWDGGAASDSWGHDHDVAASNRAKRLLARSGPPSLHQLGDRLNSLKDVVSGRRWVRRLLVTVLALGVLSMLGAGALWWRLGEGPISLDFATPWLAGAIEDNLGSDHTVQVGGTQIERAGRIRFAVRVLDIVVRGRDKEVVASAPKAEVRLSLLSLLMGRLRAESLNLVDAELFVQITPDGRLIVSTGNNARPIVATKPDELPLRTPRQSASPLTPSVSPQTDISAVAPRKGPNLDGLLAALAWIDRVGETGLSGYDLNEVGLKNGNLVVDDQQSGSKWTFSNISLALRRLSGGGVSFRIGEEEPARPWSLRASIGAAADGVRPIDIAADKVSIKDIVLAMRLGDMPYTIDLPVSGRLRGEVGRDGLPTFFTGNVAVGAGTIVDRKVPDYPMAIDQAEINVDWDSTRRVLVAPFQLRSGGNRFTLLGHVEPPNDNVPNWQLGLSGGTILLAGEGDEKPLILNRIAVRVRFDTDNKRIVLSQADFSNGDIGIAGSGTFDYSTADPRLSGGIAGTPMPVSALKRMWPPLITPELREWVVQRIESGTLSHAEIAVNAPTSTLARGGPPIPDDGLSVNFLGTNARIHPVDELPDVHDADLKIRVTGRTANVTIAQALVDTPGGRKLTISDFAFEIPDIAPKPMPSRVRFRVDGTVPAVSEILNSDRLNEFSGLPIDPATSKGNVTAQVVLAMPIKNELTKADTTYSVASDITNVAVDKLVMGQKLEAGTLKVLANNQGYQIKGDVKINGQPASLDYRKPQDADAEVKLQATLDDASRARLGLDVGPGVTGSIGVKLNGKIGGPDRESKLGVDADLSAAKVENVLPGWVKSPGRGGHVTFNVTQKPQSTRFDDVVVDGSGASIKGSIELDQNGELLNAAFPVYQPSEGDKASLKAERGSDGVLRITMRGDVFDARSFIRAASSGTSSDNKTKQRNGDFDLDIKLGAVAGFNGEAVRAVDVKLSRRGGIIKSFSLNGKVGHDTPVIGDMRGRSVGREVMFMKTDDAGALFRFTDIYAKMYGGEMWIAMDPPTIDSQPLEGLINVRDFVIRGEDKLQQVAANGQPTAQVQQNNISFSRARAEFTRDNGLLAIRDGIVSGPAMGATIEGRIDYNANQIRMSGTFLPAYALNNVFGQIPIVGLFLGGGSNEGLIGITYEVVGTPAQPTLRVNPVSAIAPGLLRKVFEFTTGRQQQAPPPVDAIPR
jgi:hypothetical protein